MSQEGGYITPPARSSTSLLISNRVLKIDYKHQAAVDAAPGTVVSVRAAKQTTVFVLSRPFFFSTGLLSLLSAYSQKPPFTPMFTSLFF